MIGLRSFEEARQVVRLPRQADDIFEVREVLDVVLDIRVERFPVGEDEHLSPPASRSCRA